MASSVKNLPSHPLAEVFGYSYADMSKKAVAAREGTLCPFDESGAKCRKDKADAPLGVCSMYHAESLVTICPNRFRENWIIAKHAAEFFFDSDSDCTALKEVRLKERSGRSAGNLDLVIVKQDSKGHVTDFGAVEIQAVYVSGNIRRPFEYYMENPVDRWKMDWTQGRHYPRPDFLSSSRKRLSPQIFYKGQILKAWGKRLAIGIDLPFFKTLSL